MMIERIKRLIPPYPHLLKGGARKRIDLGLRSKFIPLAPLIKGGTKGGIRAIHGIASTGLGYPAPASGRHRGLPLLTSLLLTISLLTISPLHAQQSQYPIRLTVPAKRYIIIEEGKRTSYYEITYDQPIMVEMKGPMNVVIEMRLNLDAYSPIIPDLVELIVERDEETYDVYRITTKSVSDERYEGIQDIIPSTKTTVRIDVPPGTHSYVFSISASATLGATLRFTIPRITVTKKTEPEKKPEVKAEKPQPKQEPPLKKEKKGAPKSIAVHPFLSAGMTAETYSTLGFFVRGGAGLDTIISEPMGINFTIAGAYYPTKYFSYDENLYELKNPSVTEIRADVTPLLTITAYGKKLTRSYIEPAIGARVLYFSAGDFTKMFIGPAGGIRFGIPLFNTLSIQAQLAGAYGLIDSKDNEAITGNPKIDAFVNLGMRIPLNHSYNLRVGFDGEFLGYPKTTIVQGSTTTTLKDNIRIYSGAFVGMEF